MGRECNSPADRRRGFDIVHVNEPHALTAAWLAGVQKECAGGGLTRVAYALRQGRLARARYCRRAASWRFPGT